MNDIRSVDPAPIPNNQPSFLVDWMITKFCNLDCSYCDSYNHDNFSKHPKYTETIKTFQKIAPFPSLQIMEMRLLLVQLAMHQPLKDLSGKQ